MTALKGSATVRCLVLMWGVIACGGDSGTASPGVDGTAEDGRILVANETEEALEVVYLREDEPSGPRIVRTEVPPGTVADVGGGLGLLPAATQIELDLALGSVDDGAIRVRRKVNVVVNGEVLVTIRLLDPDDLFSAQIEVTVASEA